MRLTSRFSRRRGSTYVLVLSTATMVTIIGLSGLMASRVQFRVAGAEEETVKARLHAQSVVDIVAFRVSGDPLWRTNHTHDTWTANEGLGELDFKYKLVDKVDTDLANDPTHAVRLHAQASVGNVTRVYSLDLAPVTAGQNVVTNSSFESDTVGWVASGGTLGRSSAVARAGLWSLLSAGRASATDGPVTDVTGSITDSTTYNAEVWVRTATIPSSAKIRMKIRATISGTTWLEGSLTPVVTGAWTRVTAVFTPTFLGTLNEASLKIEIDGDVSNNFFIDEVAITDAEPPMELIAGTWSWDDLP